MTQLLTINQLSIYLPKGNNTPPVVDNLSFSIEKGHCLGLVGESGSGKSMIASAIMQLLPPRALVSHRSSILFHGQDLLSLPEKKMQTIRGKKIAMIFQDALSTLNPVLTIAQQMREILLTHKICHKKQVKMQCLNLLNDVGIQDPERVYASYPHQLSGGMRQRAMIAMALSSAPELLIADEATTALDVTIQAQILTLLKDLQQRHHMAILFISHDLAVVSDIASDVLVLRQGKKVEQLPTKTFFTSPQSDYSQTLLQSLPAPSTSSTESNNTTTLLQTKKLTIDFPIKTALLRRTKDVIHAANEVSIEIKKGKTLALVGESGSGKTTVAKAILRLLRQTKGQLYFNQNNITPAKRHHLKTIRNNIQIIFQDPYASLNPRLTVGNSLIEGLITQRIASTKKAAFAIIDPILEKVRMRTDIKNRYPHEFSGGERQRICIARALALKPQLLILDEPTSALDVSIQHEVLTLLQSLQNDLGLSYLLITHDISLVAFLAQHIAVMKQGQIVEQGETDNILKNPQHPYTQTLLSAVPSIPDG